MDSQDKAVDQAAEPAGEPNAAPTGAPDVDPTTGAGGVAVAESPPANWAPVVRVGIAAVVAVVLAVVFFVLRANAADDNASGSGSELNTAFADGPETAAVSAAARDILTSIYSYGYGDIDGLAGRIRPLMTDQMFAEYESTSPPSAEMIKQAKTQVAAVIGDASVGVVSVTGDTAVAEVLLGVEGTNDGAAISKALLPVRLTLEKVDGKWIASGIQPM